MDYDLKIIHECQYYRLRKVSHVTDIYKLPYNSTFLTQDELIQAIRDRARFGVAEVDVEVSIELATPLLKWYLEHRVKITKTCTPMQYNPQACFKEFQERWYPSNVHKNGEKNRNQQLWADTYKLICNIVHMGEVL